MNFEKNKKNFFDNFAQRHRNVNFLNMKPSSKVEFDNFFIFFDLPRNSHIIELGCGTGRFVIPLLAQGFKVTGVDISQNSLGILENNAKKLNLLKNLTLIKNDFRQAINLNTYDAAFLVSTFHELDETKEGRIKIFSNLIESIKPGGQILLLQPNSWSPLFYFIPFHPDVEWQVEKNLRFYSFRSLKKIYQNSNLKNIEIKHFGFLPNRFINKFKKIEQINNFLCQLPLIKNFSSFVLIKGVK